MTSSFFGAAIAALGFAAPQVTPDGGLTLRDVVANVPHDASALVVYAMMLASAVVIWRAGKPSG